MPIADEPTQLSAQVLESGESGQQAGLEAVRELGASKRHQVVDAALEMADRLGQRDSPVSPQRRST